MNPALKLHLLLEKIQSEVFLSSLSTEAQISFMKLLLKKKTQKKQWKWLQACAWLLLLKRWAWILVLAGLSKLSGILASNEEQRPELKAFLGEKDGFIKLSAGYGKSLVKHDLSEDSI